MARCQFLSTLGPKVANSDQAGAIELPFGENLRIFLRDTTAADERNSEILLHCLKLPPYYRSLSLCILRFRRGQNEVNFARHTLVPGRDGPSDLARLLPIAVYQVRRIGEFHKRLRQIGFDIFPV